MALFDGFIRNIDVLTPGAVVDIFGIIIIVEFIGMMFSWIGGSRR